MIIAKWYLGGGKAREYMYVRKKEKKKGGLYERLSHDFIGNLPAYRGDVSLGKAHDGPVLGIQVSHAANKRTTIKRILLLRAR